MNYQLNLNVCPGGNAIFTILILPSRSMEGLPTIQLLLWLPFQCAEILTVLFLFLVKCIEIFLEFVLMGYFFNFLL